MSSTLTLMFMGTAAFAADTRSSLGPRSALGCYETSPLISLRQQALDQRLNLKASENTLLDQLFNPGRHTRGPHVPYLAGKRMELFGTRDRAFNQVSDLNVRIGIRENELLQCLARFPRPRAEPKLRCYQTEFANLMRAYRAASDRLATDQDREGTLMEQHFHPEKHAGATPYGLYSHNAKVTLLNHRIMSNLQVTPLMNELRGRLGQLQSCLNPRPRIDIGSAEDDMSADLTETRPAR